MERDPMLDFEYGLSTALVRLSPRKKRKRRPVFTYGPFINRPRNPEPTVQRRKKTARRIMRLNRK